MHSESGDEVSIISLQGTCCNQTRQFKCRRNNKDMHPGVSVALGRLHYHAQKWFRLREDPYLVLCQFGFFSCLFLFLDLSVCALQDVSASCSLGFLLCPDLSICLHSPGCECPLLTQIPSMSWLVCPSVLSRMWVPHAHLDSFCVLTCPSVCTLQFVSAPCSLRFLPCPDLSVHLCSSESECPSFVHFLCPHSFPSLCQRHYSPS